MSQIQKWSVGVKEERRLARISYLEDNIASNVRRSLDVDHQANKLSN